MIISSSQLTLTSGRFIEMVLSGESQPLLERVARLLDALGDDVYIAVFEKPFLEKLSSLSAEELSGMISVGDLDSWSSYLVYGNSRSKLGSILSDILLATESDLVVLYLLKGKDVSNSLDRIGSVYKALSTSFVGRMVFHTWFTGCLSSCFFTFSDDPSSTEEPVCLIQDIVNAVCNSKLVIQSVLDGNVYMLQYFNILITYLLNSSKRFIEYISLFLDAKVREGPEGCDALEHVIALVDLLGDKDYFETFYLKHLATRLLHRQSGLEPERLMISRLEVTLPALAYRAKMLIADAVKSPLIMQDFEKASTSNVQTLSVAVFDPRAWRLSKQTLSPPADLAEEAKHFEKLYKAADDNIEKRIIEYRKKRLLNWLVDLGSADIQCSFRSGTHNIQVITMQMHILSLFNTAECLSLDSIGAAFKIPHECLKEPLEELWKRSILVSFIKDEQTWFSVNEDYTPNADRLCTLQLQSVKESKLEFAETQSRIAESRKYPIDAAIVRFMKAHKTMFHSDLVAKVVEALRPYFVAEVGQIKGRVENLIDMEYLKRDSVNPGLYLYLE